MKQPESADSETLAAYEKRFSRRSLLVRYARGRVRNFLNRQIMTAAGALVLFYVNGWMSGAFAVLFALLGEIVDCLYLRGVPKRLKQGQSFRRIHAISTLTAAFQAMTISACVSLSWFGSNSAASALFPVAFLAGAAINGGLVLPHHPAAARARLAVYAGMLLVMFLSLWIDPRGSGSKAVMDICGTLIMAYLVYMFLQYVVRGFRRSTQDTMELIEKGREVVAREKEARQLSMVARNANDSVILSDVKGKITWVNDAFTQMTGYAIEDAIGRHPGELLNGPDTDPNTVRALVTAAGQGVPFRGEIQNVTRDGRSIWIDTNQVPVLDDQGNVEMTVAIERDVTDARRHAQDMAEARHAAEEGARAKAEFLAIMSHEIRTPMNGVIGMADMLSDTGLTEDQRQYVDTIRTSSEALVKIINDILDMSRLDAGKMTLSLAPFDLANSLRQIVGLLRGTAKKKGLQLSLVGMDGLPGRVVGDEGRLRQVMINLIGNALKFTEAGGVSVRVECWQDAARCRIKIAVEDTGVGIPDDRLNAIFDSFVQADAATTRRFGGTGLGLSISRNLVQAMGGELMVRSTVGRGSCFWFELPFEPVDDAPAPKVSLPSLRELADLRGMRVLLADDNRVNRMLAGKYMSAAPLELVFAEDGQEAVDKAREFAPDLVFMDMSMPVMDGIQATRRIRAGPGPQPVIVALTANAFDSDRQACLEAGMDGFLPKPVRRADLLACLVRHATHRPKTRPA